MTGALPARWVAIRTNESLVEVSPSIVMQLNDASAASRTSCCMSAGSIAASVATKPSIVAMLGRIMPAPLLMPVTATVLPPSCTVSDAAFGTVSVVMIASAASAQWSGRASASAAGSAASMRSCGSVSMITPVENGSTCSGRQPSSRASAAQVERARARPSAPVPALALPVLMRSARMLSPAARCSRQSCTGAAQNRFAVKTPATRAPGSSTTTVRSRRFALRMPAMAVPRERPAIGRRSDGVKLG